MKQLVEYQLEGSEETILVEVDEPGEPSGREKAGRGKDLIKKSEQTFDESLDRIKPAAERIVGKMKEIAVAPDEVAVEFGVKLTVKLGAVVASADAEANYKVTLIWRNGAQPGA